LKSKCQQFSLFWGLIKINRDIQAEKEIELKQIEEEGALDESAINEKK